MVILMVISWIFMVIYGDFMDFYGDFNGDLIGIYW